MKETSKEYIAVLKKLKKDELSNLVADYNKLANIFDCELIKTSLKKNDLINALEDNKETYFKNLIKSLDKDDFEVLKELIFKKNNIDFLNNHKEFINYLIEKQLIIQNDELEICDDILNIVKKVLKEKEVINYVNKWDKLYKIVSGIIIAYGVVEKDLIDSLLNKVGDAKLLTLKLDFYYKKEYVFDSKKVYSNKLTNKKKITKYLNNNDLKKFTNRDFLLLGSLSYQKKMKAYKKLIKVLKINYVFGKKDIAFVDKNVIIPYLYNSLNEEDEANKKLEETIIDLFEFRSDKLKLKMIESIKKIRDEFPLWELRGYSKMEVK